MSRNIKILSAVCFTGFAVSSGLMANAQAETAKIVREAVPEQKQVIIANSPEDMALQDEIRKIRAYNAYVNSKIGVSEEEVIYEAFSVNPDNTFPGNTFNVEIFEAPDVKISYSSHDGAVRHIIPVTTNVRSHGLKHRVSEKETLYSLARANCVTVEDIQVKNGLGDANIQLGQILVLPTSQCETSTMAAGTEVVSVKAPTVTITRQSETQTESVRKVMPVPTSIEVAKRHKYAVLPKDTLYSIGRQYCVKAKDLALHNGLDATKSIQPGQMLRIPSTACVK